LQAAFGDLATFVGRGGVRVEQKRSGLV